MAGLFNFQSNYRGGGARYAGGGGFGGMLQGLASGMDNFAKITAEQENEQSRQKFQSAQEAARQAYEMNMRRFTEHAQDVRSDKMIAAENTRHTETVTQQTADRAAQRDIENARLTEQKREHEATERRLSQVENRQIDAEQRRQDAEKHREARDDARTKVQAANQTLRDLKGESDSLNRDVNEAQKQVNFAKLHGSPDEQAQAQNDLTAAQKAKADFDQTHDQQRRQALYDIGEPDKTVPKDVASKGPDFVDAWQKGIAAGKDPQQLQRALQQASPADLQQAKQPVSKGATSSTDSGQSSDFLPTDGSTPPTSGTDLAAPSQAPAAAVASAAPSPAPTAAPADQSGAPDDQAAAPSAPDFGALAQQLSGSAGGQAVNASLQRLAESPDGPAADKMRRAAEIGLQNMGVDGGTATAYIDNYLTQNQGGAPDLDNMYNGADQSQAA